MLRFVVFLTLVGVALSQCPVQTSTETPICGGGSDDGSACKKVTTIDWDLDNMLKQQPLYYNVLPNVTEWIDLDNTCLTFLTAPDGSNFYIVYIAYGYKNGTYKFTTHIAENNGTGQYVWADTGRTHTNYVLGCTECGAYVNYRCANFAANPIDIEDSPFVFVLGPSPALRPDCLSESFTIAESFGFSTEGLLVLPGNQPSRCVTRHPCQPEDSPLYEPGGGCLKYE